MSGTAVALVWAGFMFAVIVVVYIVRADKANQTRRGKDEGS
jgi:hypothetical protein